MYINVSGKGSFNKVNTIVNGTPIIEYSHVESRHRERIQHIKNCTKLGKLSYKNMINQSVNTIDSKYYDIITKDKYMTQNIIYYPVPITVSGVRFIYEIAIFITSSKVKYDFNNPRIVADDYKYAFGKGLLVCGKPCICIETMISTIRLVSESRKAYSKYNVIDTIYLTDDPIKMTFEEFYHLTKPIIQNDSKITLQARQTINGLMNRCKRQKINTI